MEEKKILNDEQLENVHGGTRPEEIGEPIPIAYGKGIIESYRVCEKCGAAMFPVKVRWAGGSLDFPPRPDYQCSECDNCHHTTQVR